MSSRDYEKHKNQFQDIYFLDVKKEDVYRSNSDESTGFTPIMVLFMSNRKYTLHFIEEYIEKNNDKINEKNTGGYTVLDLVCLNSYFLDSYEEKMKILLKQKNIKIPHDLLESLCAELAFDQNMNHLKSIENTIKILINHGNIDVNATSIKGWGIMHTLTLLINERNVHINEKVIKMLLKKNVNVNIQNSDHKTPIYYLLGKKTADISDIFKLFLLSNKIDFSINNIEPLIEKKLKYKNIYKLYKNLTESNFYKFETSGYYDFSFNYMCITNLKRKCVWE